MSKGDDALFVYGPTDLFSPPPTQRPRPEGQRPWPQNRPISYYDRLRLAFHHPGWSPSTFQSSSPLGPLRFEMLSSPSTSPRLPKVNSNGQIRGARNPRTSGPTGYSDDAREIACDGHRRSSDGNVQGDYYNRNRHRSTRERTGGNGSWMSLYRPAHILKLYSYFM